MKKHSPKRKATELLTKEVFNYFTDRVMRLITFPATVEGIDAIWIKSQPFKLSEIEKVLGFRQLQSMFNDTELRGIYDKGTYDNRIKSSNKIQFPHSKQLAKLMIDYSDFN